MIVIEKFSFVPTHTLKSTIECNFNKGIGMENKVKCCKIKAP